MTSTQPNVALSFTTHDALRGGLCGTKWLARMVDEKANGLLGQPSVECGDEDENEVDDAEED